MLSPIFIFIFITCLLIQGRPVLFYQTRYGYNFRKFNIIKFRTMIINDGSSITSNNDSRITFLGSVLRKYKLDELPQLFNIILGDMRFIGPRPEADEYFEETMFYFLKNIKPGLSDYSSILFNDEAKVLDKIKGENSYKELLSIKILLSEYYVNKKSFIEDLKLVMLTVLVIVFGNKIIKVLILPTLIKNLPSLKAFIEKYNIF
tara:strand:+ start:1188 stop:1799 length:612 start_codon:yes stop_codon:yes gene_type:complete